MAAFKITASTTDILGNTVTKTVHDTNSGDRDFLAVSASLSTEVNKSGTLTFTITPNNDAYGYISKLKTVVRVYVNKQQYDEVLWTGRVLDTSRDFYNRLTVKCEGWLSILMDSVVPPYIFDSISPGWKDAEEKPALTLSQMMNVVIANHNNQIPANSGKQVTLTINFGSQNPSKVPSVPNYQTTLDFIQSEILSEFGGYLSITDNNNLYYFSDDNINQSVQEIAFASNLLDFTEQIDASEVYTYLIATGKDDIEVTVSADDNGTALGLFGPIYRHQDFSEIDTTEALAAAAKAELAKNSIAATTITISAVDLSLLTADAGDIKLGELVHVRSDPHGVNTWYPCSQIEYDLCDPAKTQYTLGVSPETLTSRQNAINKKAETVPYTPGELTPHDIRYAIYNHPSTGARIEVPLPPNGYINLYRTGTSAHLKFLVRALTKITPDTNATIFVLANELGELDPTYAPTRTVEGVALDETTNIRYVLKVKGAIEQGVKTGGYIQIYNNDEIEPGDILSGEISWSWKN